MPSRTAPAVATGSPDELLTQRAEKTKTAWADRDNALDRASDHYWNVGLHKDEGEIYRVPTQYSNLPNRSLFSFLMSK